MSIFMSEFAAVHSELPQTEPLKIFLRQKATKLRSVHPFG